MYTDPASKSLVTELLKSKCATSTSVLFFFEKNLKKNINNMYTDPASKSLVTELLKSKCATSVVFVIYHHHRFKG